MKQYLEPLSLEGGTFSTFTLGSSPYNDGRLRRKHKKTFTGCTICKQRKVRCTEEKPSCARCTRTKSVCSYKPPTIWRFDPLESLRKQTTPLRTPPTVFDSSLSIRDRRALAYYQERCAPIYASYFAGNFWNSIILQMSHHHPVIRDVLLGAAALFESIAVQNLDERFNLQAEYYSKYTKAISTVRQSSEELGPQTVLTACAMFANFETISGSNEHAITHTEAGLKITQIQLKRLRQAGKGKGSEVFFLVNHIEPTMAGHALQAHIYGAKMLSTREIEEAISERYQLPHVPDTFLDILQAHLCLTGIIQHIAIIDPSAEATWAQKCVQNFERLLEDWKIAFDDCERNLSVAARFSRRIELAVLRCNLGLARIAVKALHDGLDPAKTMIDDSSSEYTLLSDYNEMETSLRRAIESKGESSKSSSPEYTPPLLVARYMTTNTQKNTSAFTGLKKESFEGVSWPSQEALAVARAIISKNTTNKSVPEKSNQHILDDRLVSVLYPQIALIQDVNIQHLKTPQQLSTVGLLFPRLPKSVVARLQSNLCSMTTSAAS